MAVLQRSTEPRSCSEPTARVVRLATGAAVVVLCDKRQLMPVSESASDTLEKFKIGSLQTLYYIPEYVTEAEESSILQNLESTKSRWTQVGVSRAGVCMPCTTS
jgi:hypothetical protein